MTTLDVPAAAPASAPQPAPAGSKTPAITSDFTTFLTMLTAQMKHQDPLNPVESTDFAVQLATFSNVEQSVRANELLESMLAAQADDSGLGDPAGWIGLEAPVHGAAAFTGAPLGLRIPPGGETLIVRDASGQEVARDGASGEGGTVDWAGSGTAGSLPDGRYEFWLEGSGPDGERWEVPVPVFRPIAEIAATPQGPVVVTADGLSRPASEVDALRGG
ncbi:MAG: flagellar hook capping FlgD N-terminal domain-containing protein [Hasllibacter sp.]